jgi:FtsP/CotA-like multicopper oxidase with cupredoxin domain
VVIIRRNADAVSDDDGQFSVNFEPANFTRAPLPVINMVSGQKEFWRVLNASTNGFLTLQLTSPGPQQLQVISIDGIPLASPTNMTTISLPPAGRAEFIVPALAASSATRLVTQGYDTGPIGDPMPAKLDEAHTVQAVPPAPVTPRFAGLASAAATTKRSLYFSELNVGTNGPGQFFITVAGAQQKLYSPTNPPAITTRIGAVEDWTISNRTGESHAFHIHQLHFLVTAINGVSVPGPYMADTVTIPNWTGNGAIQALPCAWIFAIRILQARSSTMPNLDHEDGGMMATILVSP